MFRALTILVLSCSIAHADGVTLRMAAIAPDGTAWARELKALGRDVEAGTDGKVHMKWYLGAIAGDELASLERVKKGQLDGLAGALFCPRLAPSLWVTRVVGLLRSREEMRYVLNRMRPIADKEMESHGFVNMGLASFGAEIFFSRTPLHTMDDLRRARMWTWSLDSLWTQELPAMGIRSVPLPIEEAAQAYDDGKVDGFTSIPTAALAFQWSARARYFSELSAAFMPACITMSQRAFDQLPIEHQRIVRAAVAKFAVRFTDVGEQQDHALLSGLFEHQGLTRVPVLPALDTSFHEAAVRVRQDLGQKLVPAELLKEVQAWLTEYRQSQSPTQSSTKVGP